MQRRRVFGVLLTGLVLASTATAPQAAAADPCRWIAHDLPLPAASFYARTNGSSDSNRFIVGEARVGGGGSAESGLLWDNGGFVPMASPGSSMIAVHPKDVNNSGVVVGRQDLWSYSRYRAFRYRNGTYEALDTPATHSSQAISVNNLGDVVGEMWRDDAPEVRQVVVWPSSGARKDFLNGQAVGISDDRKVVQLTATSGFVIDFATGQQIEMPGARTPAVIDGDRVLYFSWGGLVERNLAGEHVATWEGGTDPYGRTSSGHVVFGSNMGTAVLWQWGIRYGVDSEKQPALGYHGDISDEGALIGTYKNADDTTHPARWFWCG
ncbi:hypothetical protein ACWGE0_02025 [Lentzea sp. NPDC054927]